MFFFFSNRLGCLGSILISVLLTVILIGIFRGSESHCFSRERLSAGTLAV